MGTSSRHGHEFDVMGDMATNDGKAGHQTRHHDVLVELVKRLRSVCGAAVEYEPKDYKDYSTGGRTWPSTSGVACGLVT